MSVVKIKDRDNLVKNLDSALTRSGRFDKKVYFDPPNFKERKDLYKLYFEDKIYLGIVNDWVRIGEYKIL